MTTFEPPTLIHRLRALRPELCTRAQQVYDDWEQYAEGWDPDRGHGGICQMIGEAFAEILSTAGIDCADGSQAGDDHYFLLVHDGTTAYRLDVPAYHYETGSGCRVKRPGVIFDSEMIVIEPCELEHALAACQD